MTIEPTTIAGVWIVTPDIFADRGQFIQAWMPDELAGHGLDTRMAQGSLDATYPDFSPVVVR